MQVSLIDIGTSKGIRLPASMLKMLSNPTMFEIKIRDKQIILDSIENSRKGWEDKFQNSPNKLLIDDILDLEEWNEI